MAGVDITTLAELRERLKQPIGVIVIRDSTGRRIAHIPGCDCFDEDDFVEKVLKNEGLNGKYIWYPDFQAAESERARWSQKCQLSA